MKQISILFLLLFSALLLSAQTEGISINATGANPDSSAILDIQSNTKGFLIPRMTTAQRDAIPHPATGLYIYNLDESAFHFYSGTVWVKVGGEIWDITHPSNRTIFDPAGSHTILGGNRSLVAGYQHEVNADESLVFGRENRVLADRSGAIGVKHYLSSTSANSFAAGSRDTLLGSSSIAMGQLNKSQSPLAILMGDGNKIDNTNSPWSTAIGKENVVSGFQSTAIGVNLRVPASNEMALGTFNELYTPNGDSTDRAFSIGNGTGTNDRSNALTVLKNGQIGIGTSTPKNDLDVLGGMAIGSSYAGTSIAPANGAIIQGNVGIGTPYPDSTLHIVGKVTYQDGSEQDGYILTSDANGVASWQAQYVDAIRDMDQDTYIEVEESPDEDVIRFGAAGKEIVRIDSISTSIESEFYVAPSSFPTPIRIVNVVPGSFTIWTTSDDPGWQSFTSTMDGRFTSFSLRFPPFYTLPPAYTFTIRKGNGPSGPILANATLTSPSSGWKSIQVMGNVCLEKDSMYTIVFSSIEGIIGTGTNTYLGGESSLDTGEDYLLRVFVEEKIPMLSFIEGDQGAGTLFVEGNVGIGVKNPTRGKVEIVGSLSHQIIGSMGYLDPSTPVGTGGGNVTPVNFSLYASDRIAASVFNAHSDRRIKEIHGLTNGTEDLRTLMQIEITDYDLKDSIAHGTTPFKKVIAQQVAEVYPQAVTTNLTEVIPDIYQRAEVQDGWIMLATDLKVGERVKLITEQSNNIYEVIEAESARFKVSGLATRTSQPETLFVYGREVDDFHTVDYEAISMLNVSATQEQQRMIYKQQQEIDLLNAKIQQFEKLEARFHALESLLSTLNP